MLRNARRAKHINIVRTANVVRTMFIAQAFLNKQVKDVPLPS